MIYHVIEQIIEFLFKFKSFQMDFEHEPVYYQEPEDYWCKVAYFETNDRVGELYHAKNDVFQIDGFTNPRMDANRFSLGQLCNIKRNSSIENTRRHIGKGMFICSKSKTKITEWKNATSISCVNNALIINSYLQVWDWLTKMARFIWNVFRIDQYLSNHRSVISSKAFINLPYGKWIPIPLKWFMMAANFRKFWSDVLNWGTSMYMNLQKCVRLKFRSSKDGEVVNTIVKK